MELLDYLEPVKIDNPSSFGISPYETLWNQVTFLDSKIDFTKSEYHVALIGVEEDRNSIGNFGSSLSPNYLRPFLYALRAIEPNVRILDLGNILGNTVKDKYFALQETLTILELNSIPALIIGGTNEFFKCQIDSLPKRENNSRICCSIVDSIIDVNKSNDGLTSNNYLREILYCDSRSIDLTMLGMQKYYYGSYQESFLSEIFVDLLRLKDLRGDQISLIETPFRDSEAIAFDVSAISSSSMPAYFQPRPNGFTALEACLIGWYAGLSTEIKSFGIYEFNPNFDRDNLGGALVAEVLWHYILGISNKSKYFSLKDVTSFQKFNVHLKSYDVFINFFNSTDGLRWWMEVVDSEGFSIVSCDKSDYYGAIQGEMPKKWWRYFQRSQKIKGGKN